MGAESEKYIWKDFLFAKCQNLSCSTSCTWFVSSASHHFDSEAINTVVQVLEQYLQNGKSLHHLDWYPW
jgi:hypothetical protein